MPMADRLRGCIARLNAENIDVFITLFPIHIRYLNGFTGSNGLLVIGADRSTFFTDGRYSEQARAEVSGCDVVIAPRGKSLIEVMAESGRIPPGARIGFEAARLSVQQADKLKSLMAGNFWIPTQSLIERLRRTKASEEMATIRQAVQITETAFEKLLDRIQPGVSERDLAIELDYLLRRMGADDIAFETIVAFGERSALPHARPTTRILKAGEPVLIDCGAVIDGYHADMTRTLYAGRAPEDFRLAYDAVHRAHGSTVASAAHGTPCREIDMKVRGALGEFADFFVHSLGHGLGLEVHETPTLSAASDESLQTGDVVTIEPGVYFPGRFGIRIENDVWISESGPVDLMKLPTGLIELPV